MSIICSLLGLQCVPKLWVPIPKILLCLLESVFSLSGPPGSILPADVEHVDCHADQCKSDCSQVY